MVQLTLNDNIEDAVLQAEPEYATVIQMSWIILFKQFRFNTESIKELFSFFEPDLEKTNSMNTAELNFKNKSSAKFGLFPPNLAP